MSPTVQAARAAALQRSRPRRRRAAGGVPPLVLAAWSALFFNAMSFLALPTVVPLPSLIGQALAQGSLVLALVLAVLANPRGLLRPHLFLVLISLPAVVALMVSIHNEFLLGSTYRGVRLVLFFAVVWVLTPWWGRRDMVLLRAHRVVLWAVLVTVVLGAVVAPGLAFGFEGRLSGVLWPVHATQAGHYAAVLLGISAVLWMCRLSSGWRALVAVLVPGGVLLATHTRTALIAAVVGLLVAGASLFLGHARVRRISAVGAVGGVLAVTLFASGLTSWVLRGQTPEEAGQLTGRTTVWTAVLESDRTTMERVFGSGLSDQSFRGLPIDSNWVATYLDQGWFGVVVDAAVLLVLFLMAATRERGARRAVALFLTTYCLVASFPETGLGTASVYTLDLVVAASLLVSEPRAVRRGRGPARRHREPTPRPPGMPGPGQGAPLPPPVPATGSTGETGPAPSGPVQQSGAAREPEGRARDPAQPDALPIDLNRATRAQLRRLPGVGPRTAAAVVRWRREQGPFRSVADLRRVKGIGPATYRKIAAFITVEDP